MKCPKCGSKIKENKDRDVVWDRGRTAFCNKCHIEYRIDDETNDIIYTQPTTAEMLLWLARYNIDIIHASFKDICSSGEYVIIKVRQDSTVTPYKGKTLAEAVKRAYDWAIKEEQK